jgi:hypothetical protein
MPDATVSMDLGPKIDLKSIEGGWVRLKPMPFGKKLERRDKATRMSMMMEADTRRSRGKKEEPTEVKLDILNRWSTAFDFAECIGEHNLTDHANRPLDLSNPDVLDVLDPRVGTEIEALIAELIGDDEELTDFTQRPILSSVDENPLTPSLKTESEDT